mgnify:CR=1 FL=1|jgi:hypothetical protein
MRIKSATYSMTFKTLSAFLMVLLVLLLLVFPRVAFSQELQLKVQTRMPYAENNDQGDRRELVHQFKKDAFKKMMSDPNTPQTKARLIGEYFDEMTDYEKVDQFFTKYVFAEQCDTGSGSNCGIVRDQAIILQGMAFISMNAVDNFLQSKSAASTMATSDFATLFIARKVADRKIFQAKTTDIKQNKSTSSVEVVSGSDDITNVSGGTSEDMQVRTTGGSTSQKSDEFVYDIDLGLTEALQAAIQETLVNAGFEPFSMDDVLYDYDMDGLEDLILNGEFGEDGSLNRRTLAAIKKIAAEDEVTFLGIGRVDYRQGEKNPVTGDMRVPASVTVEVVMKKGKRMRTVASVAPTIIYGNYQAGEDYSIGQLVAQNAAVKQAMDTIISQLQSKGLY